MTLREKQSIFASYVAELIFKAVTTGYEVTLGEAWRSPEEAARLAKLGLGIRNSLHTKRLAIDINLFKNGIYLDKSEDYLTLGEWWESLTATRTDGIEFCWGGRFSGKRVDGNHFSIAHYGVK